ncbi:MULTISPECIES: aldose 1-epimerase family protein [unclassified Aureimonas]|uniref:aldose 1-epimerase family protein n=1 Tax=unclassified Aureimonas TaxID=2615206 RepID=UPI0006FE2B51|nr:MULTISPECIES: aldose 1-epimerase family protein [unclassified Aureimonas]KQT52441.1 deoxyribose mutarotase [Aureimonas sp. Leaf427]KQT77658.1 deoxyribose mutarotase [Aureimonas sp. Leaf460]
MVTRFELRPAAFDEVERACVQHGELSARLFRYPTGVEAIQLSNRRGSLVVLPYLGQMIWSAAFDGVDLTMTSIFKAPRRVRTIAETYGCFAFHSGLLRNGVPGPEDDHAAHGEIPCAPMDDAAIEAGEDEGGPYLRILGSYDYAMGFGAHYLARPSVTLRAGSALFDMAMEVRNLSGAAMDLMYMCHANFAYAEGAEILQRAPFTPERTRVRRQVPRHVAPNPDYLAFIEELAADPSGSRVLGAGERYDPEQVFYIEAPETDADGETQAMLRRPAGDAFVMRYRPAEFPKTVRWILKGADQSVAAFALPSTCEPEGYAAEKAKGNVKSLAPGATAAFTTRLGHLDAEETRIEAARFAQG